MSRLFILSKYVIKDYDNIVKISDEANKFCYFLSDHCRISFEL